MPSGGGCNLSLSHISHTLDKPSTHLFVTFLRYCLCSGTDVPATIASISWADLLAFARKQAIVGICWQGISAVQSMGVEAFRGNKPTDDDVLDWMAAVRAIQKKNGKADEVAAWAAANFGREGFEACVLKGQGAALLYPDPSLRTPGDVDIWVRPKRKGAEKTAHEPEGAAKGPQEPEGVGAEPADRTVIAYVRRVCPDAKACYHHIDFVSRKGVPIEVHYRPQWLNSPLHNRRLQRYFAENAGRQFANGAELPGGVGSISVPTSDFNVVFMLSHIYNHLLHEGIGLRQLIDYYYLLRSRPTTADGTEWDKLLSHLGLMPIAGAVMWLMQEVLGLESGYLLVPPDERLGRVVLREMMAGGNFGKHDDRLFSDARASALMKNFQRIVRDLRLVWYFPSECLWEPWFRIWHWVWRQRHG